jgi:hypothetical protein
MNCGLYGPIAHPRVIAMWTMVWWYRLGLTSQSSIRALWQPPVLSVGPISRDISGASRRMGEGNENVVYSSPWDFKRCLTCHKILRHGDSGFTSHPKEGVLRICIALKKSIQKSLYRKEKSNSALLRTVILVDTCLNVLKHVSVWVQDWGTELTHVHTFWTIFVTQYLKKR